MFLTAGTWNKCSSGRPRCLSRALLTTSVILVVAASLSIAHAQTFTILYSFHKMPDGTGPTGLILYASGRLYGTTQDGGSGTSCPYYGCGTIYRLDKAGKEEVLYSFNGSGGDGRFPNPGLIRDAAGTVYGTTVAGGTFDGGVVFKLGKTGKETILHSFGDGTDGAVPSGGVVRDPGGNFFGTTEGGGNFGEHCSYLGCGTVFELDTTGYENKLYAFTGNADGSMPIAGLIRDAQGNLYGTTYGGGDQACELGCGVVFKLDTTGRETVLYSFTGGKDGANPSGIIRDDAGNLYGTATAGGCSGNGMVFKLDKSGRFKVLHCFAGEPKDGSGPGGLTQYAGKFYGTTVGGGGGNCYDYYGTKIGCGIVFRLDKNGKERVLHRFPGGKGGSGPYGLAMDAVHNFYGTTGTGGDTSCNVPYGCGTVFKLTAR